MMEIYEQNVEEQQQQYVFGKGSGAYCALLDESNNDILNERKKHRTLFNILPHSQYSIISIHLGTTVSYYLNTETNPIVQTYQGDQLWMVYTRYNRSHALLKAIDNSLYGIGSNLHGELSLPLTVNNIVKAQPIIQYAVTLFHAGFRQSYYMINNQLWGCGQSKNYQLGLISNTAISWRLVVPECNKIMLSSPCRLLTGRKYLLIVGEDGSVYAMGDNSYAVFGTYWANIKQLETLAKIYDNCKLIVSGWQHVIIGTYEDSFKSFGRNNFGQLGREQHQEMIEFEVKKGEKIVELVAGSEFTFARTSCGRIFGWGWNEHKNIIDNNSNYIRRPVLVSTHKNASTIFTNCATTIILSN